MLRLIGAKTFCCTALCTDTNRKNKVFAFVAQPRFTNYQNEVLVVVAQLRCRVQNKVLHKVAVHQVAVQQNSMQKLCYTLRYNLQSKLYKRDALPSRFYQNEVLVTHKTVQSKATQLVRNAIGVLQYLLVKSFTVLQLVFCKV